MLTTLRQAQGERIGGILQEILDLVSVVFIIMLNIILMVSDFFRIIVFKKRVKRNGRFKKVFREKSI
ncbi:MAG: hypothetical protein UR12_C0018G0010 [candidate division TM6 bacterium GW2011_GWF2_30_66]|jgi:hypothetical protein|nr:MAG: hypothetical protein UR12_C0018G0010 [candidate division TM6 bacterium GW2011_GWF2_30_66]